MDSIRKFEPLWGVWQCESVLGKGGFGKVYKAVRHDGEHTYYSAIKHISVPEEDQLMEARNSGMYSSEKELSDYFNDVARNVQYEIDLMYKLKANTNIVSYEDHMVIPKENGIGCDIFIRMELLEDLNKVILNKLTEADAVKIGTDICTALEVCARHKIIHRDIKPSNIFVNENGDYKLGDFGIARVMSSTTMGVSKKGTYSYMAPEIYKCEPANHTSDIYSLGVVLYRILNNNRLPFMPLTGSIRAQDQEAALIKTVSGAPMPPPVNASPRLAAVILKACAYNMRDRFKSPTEFKKALNDAFYASYYDQDTVSVRKGKVSRAVPEPAQVTQITQVTQINQASPIQKKTQVNFSDTAVRNEPSAAKKSLDKSVTAVKEKTASAADWVKEHKTTAIISSAVVVLIAVIAIVVGVALTNSKSIPEPVYNVTPDGIAYEITNDCVVITGYSGKEKNIKIPRGTDGEKVIAIGNSAFSGCSSLTSIDIPDSVTSIGHSAFENCSALTSIEIPDSVTSIGHSAFENCSALTSIEIPDSVTTIGYSAFRGCRSFTSIEIPDSVTTIGDYAFSDCSALASMEIPDSVTSIGDSVFENCSALTSIEIPDSVTTIGYSTFYGCDSLTSIEIPDSVTSIGDSAFGGCYNATVYAPHDASYYGCNDNYVKKWVVE